MSTYRLAQINIARMLAPIDDPLMAEFAAQLPSINALADTSPGFVWRLQTEAGDATSLKVYDDDLIIVNMSVWESVESLHEYAYRSSHTGVLKYRTKWFERFDGPHMALWWIPVGHVPTLEEGKERLDYLQKNGNSPYAFTFKKMFPAPVE
jgi:hypothetical protein